MYWHFARSGPTSEKTPRLCTGIWKISRLPVPVERGVLIAWHSTASENQAQAWFIDGPSMQANLHLERSNFQNLKTWPDLTRKSCKIRHARKSIAPIPKAMTISCRPTALQEDAYPSTSGVHTAHSTALRWELLTRTYTTSTPFSTFSDFKIFAACPLSSYKNSIVHRTSFHPNSSNTSLYWKPACSSPFSLSVGTINCTEGRAEGKVPVAAAAVRVLGNPLAPRGLQVVLANRSPSALVQGIPSLPLHMDLVEERSRQFPLVNYLLVDRKVVEQEPKYMDLGLSLNTAWWSKKAHSRLLRQYGSGYPGVTGRGVQGRGFPFIFWPLTWVGISGVSTQAYLHRSSEVRSHFNTDGLALILFFSKVWPAQQQQ